VITLIGFNAQKSLARHGNMSSNRLHIGGFQQHVAPISKHGGFREVEIAKRPGFCTIEYPLVICYVAIGNGPVEIVDDYPLIAW
jgi:hypothetical protein